IMRRSTPVLQEQSLLTAFVVLTQKKPLDEYQFLNPKRAMILIDKEILNFRHSDGDLIKIREISSKDIHKAIDKIRCLKEFDFSEKESLVYCYLQFFNWVRTTTFLDSLNVSDPDKQNTQRRLLDYHVFTRLLNHLDERCRLVTKLLYLGADRTLPEVINLDIKGVNFETCMISFHTGSVARYPLHVFEDIKNIIGERKSGKVFLGKNKTSLNAATIFRNFKKAAAEMCLNMELSPKILSTNT
ncbi:MAG: hypothetical protein WCJ72_19795, partial [Chryseobacterium sp.]